MSKERDEALESWYESIVSDNYRNRAKYSVNKFFRFLAFQGWKEVSGDLILERHVENRKSDDKKVRYYFDDLLPSFLKWLEDGGLAHNSSCTSVNTIRGFFKFHREPLQVQNGKIKEIEKAKSWHCFSLDELIKMVQVGDLEEKAIIMLGKDLGIRVGDFVQLKRKPLEESFKDQDGVFPIEFQIETEKEGIVAIGHIMEETWNILQLYWKNSGESDYVFPSNNERLFISEDRANDALKSTWVKALPDRPDVKIRFHELRSYKMSVLSNAGVNEWQIKRMVGKKNSNDIQTYLTGVNLKESFKKAEAALSLTQATNNHSKLEQLEAAIEQLQKENSSTRAVSEIMTKKTNELENKVKPLMEFIDSFENPEDLKRFAEVVKGQYILRSLDDNVSFLGLRPSTSHKDFILSLGRDIASDGRLSIEEAVQKLMIGMKNIRGMDEDEERVWEDVLKVARAEDEDNKEKEKKSS
ncbi:MAG: site-specific integrase [Candidatus Bathyarchaeota archaeon]